MAQYQKKPVTVEAVKFDYSTECISALLALGLDPVRINYAGAAPTLRIDTLEGTMTAQLGDYIIRGINGEFYPCKPDIFEKTYEEV